MKTCTRLNDLPGPGDPETWGPCTGHPMDPRTPDEEGLFDDMREQLFRERMGDTEYWVDALAEADKFRIDALRQAYALHDMPGLVGALFAICHDWMVPTDGEIWERIEAERDADDARMEDKWDAELDLL